MFAQDASRKHIIAVFGFLCFGMGALITVLCWKDGLRGLWTFDPNLMLYDAAAGAGIVLPAPAVVSGPAKFTSKANEDLSHLYHSALEDVFSIWNVLWLVSMNHLIVKFYLAGFRALVFTFDCSSVNGGVSQL